MLLNILFFFALGYTSQYVFKRVSFGDRLLFVVSVAVGELYLDRHLHVFDVGALIDNIDSHITTYFVGTFLSHLIHDDDDDDEDDDDDGDFLRRVRVLVAST